MSLAKEADERKARLLALRKKKEGANGTEQQRFVSIAGLPSILLTCYDSGEPLLSGRNFDPESRTLRKRRNEEDNEEDTVEKHIAGLAEQIVAEDEETRAQDLVGLHPSKCCRP